MSSATTPTGKALSQKIRWLLEAMGPSAVARLARACEVRAPSVYTWRDKGQVDKRHIPTFAELSGTRLAWWLDPQAPVPPTAQWLAATRTKSPDSEFADGFAQAILAPDSTPKLLALEAKALQAFRGLTTEQQRKVISAMEAARKGNRQIIELSIPSVPASLPVQQAPADCPPAKGTRRPVIEYRDELKQPEKKPDAKKTKRAG